MKCGDVLLVNYPFTDTSGAKVRPALVVSVDAFNRGNDIVVVPISSSPAATDPHVFPILDTDPFFASTGLKRSSAVKWTKPLTVSRTVVHSRLGLLPIAQLDTVHTKLRSLFT